MTSNLRASLELVPHADGGDYHRPAEPSSDRRKAQGNLLGPVLILAAITLFMFAYTISNHQDMNTWGSGRSLAGIGMFIALITTAVRQNHHARKESLGPSALLLWMVLLLGGIILPATLVVALGSGLEDIDRLRDLGRPANAIWLYNCGLAFTSLGYMLVPRRKWSIFSLNSRHMAPARLKFIFVVGCAMAVLNILTRGRSIDGRLTLPPLLAPFEQLITLGRSLMLLAIVALAAARDSRSTHTARWMVAVVSLIGFADGFFKPTFWALVVYALARAASVDEQTQNSRPLLARRWAPRILASFAVLIFVVPLVQETRDLPTSGSPITDLATAYDKTWGSGIGVGWSVFVEKSLGRQSTVFVGGVRLIDRVPDRVPFQGIDRFILIPTYAIPRFLWVNKPVLSFGAEISTEIYDQPADTRSSSTLTIYGDAYWFAGLATLVLAAILIGMLLKLVDDGFRSSAALAVRLSLLPLLLAWENNIAQWLVQSIQGILLVGLVAYLAARPSHPNSHGDAIANRN